MNLASAKIATCIKDKQPDEIKDILSPENDIDSGNDTEYSDDVDTYSQNVEEIVMSTTEKVFGLLNRAFFRFCWAFGRL